MKRNYSCECPHRTKNVSNADSTFEVCLGCGAARSRNSIMDDWQEWGSIEIEGDAVAEPTDELSETEQLELVRKYPHYYKDVRHLKIVDIYRILELFEVDNPSLAHAAKKLLCAGRRGAKDATKDIREVRDSLTRWLRMREEDKAAKGE